MSYDGLDDPHFNPFAEDQASASNLSQPGYYSSAFFPMLSNTRPTLRRRRSSLSAQSLKDGNESEWTPSKHTRARTELQIMPHSPVVHPLKSALAAINGPIFPDLGITRPHLSRIVNDSSLMDASDSTEGSLEGTIPSFPDQEKDVIVHQVCFLISLCSLSFIV